MILNSQISLILNSLKLIDILCMVLSKLAATPLEVSKSNEGVGRIVIYRFKRYSKSFTLLQKLNISGFYDKFKKNSFKFHI